jgi:glycosyltransferase involved in cell wall biosynthesis
VDFQQIASTLERFLDAHPETRLQITGHLNHGMRAREGQVVHSPRVPFAKYAERVRCGWVNLCPLEPSPFNACKSAIKVIEAGYWNIPTICSPNPDCERFLGAGAIVASTAQEWFDALESLLDDVEYSDRTDKLRERTLALADADVQAKALLQLVERCGG